MDKNDILWNSGTQCSPENPKKAERIKREVEQTKLTGSFIPPTKEESEEENKAIITKQQKVLAIITYFLDKHHLSLGFMAGALCTSYFWISLLIILISLISTYLYQNYYYEIF